MQRASIPGAIVGVWREGQRRVMELFENTTIASVRRPRIVAAAQGIVNPIPTEASKAQL